MVQKLITSPHNVIELSRYRQDRASVEAPPVSLQLCRHCGAPLLDGENDEDCSSAFNLAARAPRRFYVE